MTQETSFKFRAYLKDIVAVLSWRALQVVGLTLLLSLTEGASLLLLAPLLELVGLSVDSGSLGRVTSAVTQTFAALRVPLNLGTVLGVYLAIVILGALLARYATVANFALQQRFVVQLRARLYGALTRANWLFFVRRRNSDFMHKLTHELETVGSATFELLEWIVTLLLTAIYLAYAFYLSPVATLFVLASGAALNIGLRAWTRRAQSLGGELSSAYESLFAAISEHFAGMKVAKSHGVEDEHAKLFLRASHRVEEAQVAVTQNQEVVYFWFQVGAVFILALTIYLAVTVLNLATASMLLLLYLFSRLIPMLSSLQSGYQSFLSSTPAYLNIRALERECAAAAEPSSTDPSPAESTPRLNEHLVFERVTFGYEPAQPVLEGFSFRIEAGKTTALVGPSGVGKSTVADLAVGLLTPTEGRLLLDGEPLEAADLSAWRHQLGYVSQDTFIFHDTVSSNLLLTKPGASDQELTEALRVASAEFVLELSDGLDTVLGDRGVRLSGGERQRLALARAVLRRPALLVLDEATSSLDAENEARIQRAVEALQGRMTMLVIAHRLATVRNADMIHVLEGGRIVESGSWSALVAKPGGRFRALCEAQGFVREDTVEV